LLRYTVKSDNLLTSLLGHFKKIGGDRPRPPHEKGPTPKTFLFKKNPQKNVLTQTIWPSSGGQQYQSSSNEVQLRPSAPLSVIIEVEIIIHVEVL
jgi:hypothetical protein